MTGTYQRERRIVKTDDFSSVFRMRPARRTAHFVLYARTNHAAHARLGIVVAKRFAPRAVTRNTIKRMTREVFRQSVLQHKDCIVRLIAPVNTKAQPATSTRIKSGLRKELLELFSSQHLN
ncbi:MAG: ribonuclease P protein component [Oxalobacter sp.]|nr:MAG: ribonuclease P protein component [Oxalobacter sp.]